MKSKHPMVGKTVATTSDRALGGTHNGFGPGKIGKVVCTNAGTETLGVDFGEGFDGHTLEGAIKTRTGFWFRPEELRVVKPAKKKAPAKGKAIRR